MDTIKRLLKAMDERDKRTPKPYDTQATVTRIEDGKAYVVLPGQTEETEVKLTIGCKVGDTVQVRVSDHKAFLVGNGTAPPTDDTYARQVNKKLTEKVESTNMVVRTVQRAVNAVRKIAANTNQYFWHTETGTDTGAHITEIPQEEFLADPDNGGGNLLARSNGVAVRDGLTELAQLANDGMRFNDGAGNTVVDIDTAGELVSKSFTEHYDLDSYVSASESITLSITNPYFANFDTSLFAPEIFLATQDGHQFINFDPTQDATIPTSFDVTINYSSDTKQITLTYVGSDASYEVYSLSVTWSAYIIPPYYTFGLRQADSETGAFSFASGIGLIANKDFQTVVGKYNEETDAIFAVGCGTDNGIRKNGLEVFENGNVNSAGQIRSTWRQVDIPEALFTLESGITCNLARYTRAGNLATLYMRIRSSADKSGTWTVGTLLEGYRPVDEVGFMTATAASIGYINSAGVITYIGSLGANSNGYIKATYMVE